MIDLSTRDAAVSFGDGGAVQPAVPSLLDLDVVCGGGPGLGESAVASSASGGDADIGVPLRGNSLVDLRGNQR